MPIVTAKTGSPILLVLVSLELDLGKVKLYRGRSRTVSLAPVAYRDKRYTVIAGFPPSMIRGA